MQTFEKLIFKKFENNYRYTQDSPVYPDVWMEYFNQLQKQKEEEADLKNIRVDLILTPNRKYSASELLKVLRENISKHAGDAAANGNKTPLWRLANTGESVAAYLTLPELIHSALPLTPWWQEYLWGDSATDKDNLDWLKKIVGYLIWYQSNINTKDNTPFEQLVNEKLPALFDEYFPTLSQNTEPLPSVLWSVSKNRKANINLYKSVAATKADASRRVFDIDGSKIAWAVLDTGIDARHEAFSKNKVTGDALERSITVETPDIQINSRIVATYDFTRFRTLLANLDGLAWDNAQGALRQFIKDDVLANRTSNDGVNRMSKKEINDYLRQVEGALRAGRMIDWSVIAPLLRIPHNTGNYIPPSHPHGTHVAGIIGANWQTKSVEGEDLIGMCPGISLYDIRVLDNNGVGEEFNILAAIQFVRWLNRQNNELVVHGINLSLSMIHEVASFACGRTPVCEACQRLIAEGTVVVAAAGNLGQAIYQSTLGSFEQGFRTVNISDPGNAESVITVGATHRNKPHTYGVSYFSSRGPTGDGRNKPDIVAPGEKIVSTTPNNSYDRMDGSSMAAPHVSGAAALLLAKHQELIGQPQQVKEILCNTATDLGRERYFQGHGMLDVLRALQSV